MLATIGYISNAIELLKKGEIESIVKNAITYNRAHGITGVLYSANGKFLQFIEGERIEIETLYEKILKDNRHSDVVIVYDADIDKRSFGDWDMAIRHPGHYESTEIELFDKIFNIYNIKFYKTAEQEQIKMQDLIDVFRKPVVRS